MSVMKWSVERAIHNGRLLSETQVIQVWLGVGDDDHDYSCLGYKFETPQ